jgi:integrase
LLSFFANALYWTSTSLFYGCARTLQKRFGAVAKFAFTITALNKRFAQNPAGVVWDTTRGLGCYRNRDGSLSLFAQYRCGTKAKKRVLGRVTEISLAEARTQATELLLNGRNGKDIVAEAKAKAAKALTLGDSYVAYMESLRRKGCSQNTIHLNTVNYTKHLSHWEGRELTSLTRADCRGLHTELLRRGPTLANQVLRLLRTIISYAMKRLDIPPMQNPVLGVEWHREVGARKSIPTSELAAFWEATGRIENQIRRAYWRGLLLTGLRRQELATLRWEHVLEDRVKIVRPKGGEKRAFEVALTSQLKAVLEEARQAGAMMFPSSPFVFPAASSTGYVLNPFDPALPGVSPHQLRRTFVTCCIECGLDPFITKALVNHAQNLSDMTSRYLQISEDRLREAAARVTAFIETHAQVMILASTKSHQFVVDQSGAD